MLGFSIAYLKVIFKLFFFEKIFCAVGKWGEVLAVTGSLSEMARKAPFRKGVARRSRDGGLPAHSLYRNISNRGCSGAAIPTALRAEPLSKGAFWEESWRFQRRWPKEPYLKTDPAIVEFFTKCDTLKNIFVTGVTFAKIYGIINNSMGF